MLSKLWSPSVQIVAQSSHCEEYLEQNWSTLQVLVPHLAPLKVIAASTVLSLTSGISSTADTANNIILRWNVLLAMDDINCTGVINSQVRHSRFLSLLFFPALNSFVWLDGMLFAQTRFYLLSSISSAGPLITAMSHRNDPGERQVIFIHNFFRHNFYRFTHGIFTGRRDCRSNYEMHR